LSFSIEDRLRILHRLDATGFPFVEGGWPGANPRDTEFFRLASKEKLQHATLTAFGMTRKAGERAERSSVRRDLPDAETELVRNDAGCTVANSLLAVEAGAFQVQGTINGYGERTGNADLVPIAANLEVKMGQRALPEGAVATLTELAHYVAEVANLPPDSHQP